MKYTLKIFLKAKRRESIYQKFNGHCAYCGESIKLKDMQIDHVIPRSRFFNMTTNKFRIPVFLKHLTPTDCNHYDNLFPSCRVCNKWKNDFDLELFRDELTDQVKRLNEYSSNYRIAKRYELVTETIKPIVFYFERGAFKNIFPSLNEP